MAGNGGLPTTRTRAVLAALQSFGPYFADRVVRRLERAGAEESAFWEGSFEEPSLSTEWRPFSSNEDATAADASGHSRANNTVSSTHGASSPAARLERWLARARQQLSTWHSSAVRHWPAIKPWALFVGRAHLALFYYYGVYYEWSKRLAGVTYAPMSAPQGARWVPR